MSSQRLRVIGVDAGGSHTRAVLVDERGRVLAWGTGGPANPTRVPLSRLRTSLYEAIAAALSASNTPGNAIDAICLGIAGSKGYKDAIAEVVSGLGIHGRITIFSDAEIAFWGAISRSYGIIVIAGTGSSAYGVGLQGEMTTAGGRGYLVGDEGSAYDIGRAGIKAALKSADGREPGTDLFDQMMRHYDLGNVDQIIPTLYNPIADDSRTRISSFAPRVVVSAQEGDELAAGILHDAGRELGVTVLAVARRLHLCNQKVEVALIGGVFQAGTLITDPLRDSVLSEAPAAEIFVSARPPALGAVRLAFQAMGQDISLDDFSPSPASDTLESGTDSEKRVRTRIHTIDLVIKDPSVRGHHSAMKGAA